MNELQAPEVWAAANELEPAHMDCVTAVMLKILDGKCKMDPAEKQIMLALYEAVKARPGLKLGEDMHSLIARAKAQPEEDMVQTIYEHRILAETMISRPVMKSFKAMLRAEGVLPKKD